MSETSPSKLLPLQQIPGTTEPSTSQQLKQSLQLQQIQQQQEDWKVKLSSIANNLSQVPNFQGIQRNIPVPRPDKKQRNNKYLLRIMRQQQLYQQQLHSAQTSSGGINSTQQRQQHPQQTKMVQAQQQMVQPLQQTGSLNLTSQFRANGTLNVQERVTPAQLRQLLSLQDALAATQAHNALTSELTQNGQSGAIQNGTSPQPWFKQMQVTDFPDSSLDHLHRQRQLQLQQQSPRMVGPGDQISVCSIGSQTDNATPGESSSHGAEASNELIRKRIIHDVVSQLDLNGNLDPETEDLLLKIAANFIDSVTTLACTLAKHPKSSTSHSKDALLHAGSSKEENSKSSVCDFSDRKPQAVYCHCGLEATAHTSSIQPNRGTRFRCCSKIGGQQCGFFEWCDPEMCRRCNETIPGILRKVNAQDATINDLKILYRELRMAVVICVFVMLFMLSGRLIER